MNDQNPSDPYGQNPTPNANPSPSNTFSDPTVNTGSETTSLPNNQPLPNNQVSQAFNTQPPTSFPPQNFQPTPPPETPIQDQNLAFPPQTPAIPHWATPNPTDNIINSQPQTNPAPVNPPSASAEINQTIEPTATSQEPFSQAPIHNQQPMPEPTVIGSNLSNGQPQNTNQNQSPEEPSPIEIPEPAPTDLSHLAAMAQEAPQTNPGTPFTPNQFVPPIQVNATTENTEDKEKKVNMILLIGLPIIALIVLFGSIYYFFFMNTPDNTITGSVPAETQQAPLTQPPTN